MKSRKNSTKNNGVVVRRATPGDIPAIVKMMSAVPEERGAACGFDPYHTWRHITELVCDGVCIIADLEGRAVGVVMCSYIQLAYNKSESLETAHLYVVPDMRNCGLAFDLLSEIEDYVKENCIKLIVHYLDDLSVIEGGPNDLEKVVKLFQRRGYTGPIGDMRSPDNHEIIGQSYLFVG